MAKLFIPKRLFSAHEKKTGGEDRRKWDEIRKKWLLCLYYHFPMVLLGFSYDAYMMRI